MTDEELKQGQELKAKIDRLKGNIEYWEKATNIIEIRLQYSNAYPSESRTFTDEGYYVNFEVLKTLTLQAMRTELEKFEKEYGEL